VDPNELNEIADLNRFKDIKWTRRLATMTRADYEDVKKAKSYKECIKRVKALRDWMRGVFVGKDDLIELMLISTIAQLPMLMLGTWGTAKSMLVRKLAEGLGISAQWIAIDREDDELADILAKGLPADEPGRRHFEYLVTRFTTPEEVLGSANVDLVLNQSVYMRQTRGLLPRAEVVFLDEVFKANSSILNALLAIMNERIFHNAGRTWKTNVIMIFGASNEPPREEDAEELGAFYDRFPVRAVCEPVVPGDLERLLAKAHEQSVAAEFRDAKPAESPMKACVCDFRLLNKMSLLKFGGEQLSDDDDSKEFVKRFRTAFEHLRLQYDLSDRSFGQYYRLARARALLDGRDHLCPRDGKVLYYCGKDPNTANELRAVVDRFLS
jgi:MoxR-like ATPase